MLELGCGSGQFWAANTERFREEQTTEKRNRFFGAYMVKAKQGLKITVNREALQRALTSNL